MLSTVALADALPGSTWTALSPLPASKQGTIFGLAVNPTSSSQLIAGDSNGAIYRSATAGASWSRVYTGKVPIIALSYDSLIPGVALAGTQGGGVLISNDAGVHWSAAAGTDGRTVRAIAFARTVMVAATDRGVYTSPDGSSWTLSGLAGVSIDAVSIEAVNNPVKIIAGGDAGTGAIPMYRSNDGGVTWNTMSPAISGTIVTRLASGPLPSSSSARPLVVGTNTGLFISTDGGGAFLALSGAQLLPSTDYTQIVFTSAHFDRFYVASDGGGGESGGLWATADSGQHFSSLQPPGSSVTALAVSSDEEPVLYAATFRASDHAAMLWAYRDTGGTPQGPFISPSPNASGARPHSTSTSLLDAIRSLGSSQAPYIALGAIALGLILLAAISHFRGRRR